MCNSWTPLQCAAQGSFTHPCPTERQTSNMPSSDCVTWARAGFEARGLEPLKSEYGEIVTPSCSYHVIQTEKWLDEEEGIPGFTSAALCGLGQVTSDPESLVSCWQWVGETYWPQPATANHRTPLSRKQHGEARTSFWLKYFPLTLFFHLKGHF